MNLLVEKKLEIENYLFYFSLFHLHKSYLLLISDQEKMGIGNVTLSSPPTIQGVKASSASYNLFGMKERLLSKIIAEKTSSILNAPVLLLLFLKNVKKEEEIAKSLITFLNDILEEIIQKKNKE